MSKKSYPTLLRPHLTNSEQKLLSKLSSPTRIQDFLDHFPTNLSPIGEPVMNLRSTLAKKRAHCIEGALLACTSLLFNNQAAWLMDLQASTDDEDHVVCLFKQQNLWGAISKTNHPVLRYRDAVYKNVRELAMSYFNEYFLFADEHFDKKVLKNRLGSKTLRAYSKPFAILKYDPKRLWTDQDLDWLAEELDSSRHFPLVPKSQIKNLRKVSKVEIKAANLEEYKQR